MSKTKLAIIYYSSYGTNTQMINWAKEMAESLNSEVRVRQVQELAPEAVVNGQPAWKANVAATKDIPLATSDDLVWADAILFSMPTRFGNMPSQMKQFIDMQGSIWAQGKLTNKFVSAMTSAQNINGGQEATLLNFYTTIFHWGAFVVTPDVLDPAFYQAGGNPYGTSVTINREGDMLDDVKGAVQSQTKRLIEVATQFNN